MHGAVPSPGPVRAIAIALYGWSAFALGLGIYYVATGHPAAWAGVGVGVLSGGLAVWGRRRGVWLQPLFAALYILALGMVVAGPAADLDIYVVGGALGLILLTVGACILFRLGELRDALTGRGRHPAE